MLQKLVSLNLVLERMDALYERMEAILLRERELLVILDYESLLSSLKEKDEVLNAIKGLDRERLRTQDLYAHFTDRPSGDITLILMGQELVGEGGDSRLIGEQMLRNREKLRVRMERLRELTSFNASFTQKSIDTLRGLAESVSAALQGRSVRSEKESSVYTGQAKYGQQPKSTGAILEKRL